MPIYRYRSGETVKTVVLQKGYLHPTVETVGYMLIGDYLHVQVIKPLSYGPDE